MNVLMHVSRRSRSRAGKFFSSSQGARGAHRVFDESRGQATAAGVSNGADVSLLQLWSHGAFKIRQNVFQYQGSTVKITDRQACVIRPHGFVPPPAIRGTG